MLDPVLEYLKNDNAQAVGRMIELLKIPSVSTDPAFAEHVKTGAGWVAQTLESLGLNAQIRSTAGHPVVVAKASPQDVLNPTAPRVLFYGHYDVQPPDPLDGWTTPAFEPNIRDNAVHARGACDDKGQICTFFEALRAWKNVHGKFPVPITVMIEGEEEMGSKHLPAFIQENKDELACDVVLISDTTMWDKQTIAITYALRGLLYFDIKLHNSNRDLHSGMYGGTLANPATIITKVLGQLFDENNQVTIPGFYDDVIDISNEERAEWETLHFDEMKHCLTPIGVNEPFGEKNFTTLERKWARPACDINGIYGGYMGEGAKTVIPSFAGAKVSFRIAANQDPEKIATQFESWLRSFEAGGCRWEITNLGGCPPVMTDRKSPFVAAAVKACEVTSGRPPVLVREGATIPVVADFQKTLGAESLLIGFGLTNDRIHAPNEKFDLDCFALGCQTHAALLAELAQTQ